MDGTLSWAVIAALATTVTVLAAYVRSLHAEIARLNEDRLERLERMYRELQKLIEEDHESDDCAEPNPGTPGQD
jgi:hypothetical protein